jgi:hypothetical protein
MELWLVAEAESRHEMLRAQAERDRLARQLAKAGRPLRLMLAAVLRRIADGIDARTGVAVRQEHVGQGLVPCCERSRATTVVAGDKPLPYVSFLAE